MYWMDVLAAPAITPQNGDVRERERERDREREGERERPDMSVTTSAAAQAANLASNLRCIGRRSSYLYKSHFLTGISFKYSVNVLFLKNTPKPRKLVASASTRRFSPVMEWQDCSAEIEVDVPCSVAYDCYSDRESIPLWMPFISSVKVLKDKPDLSRWYLKYEVLGQNVEFSWLARNLQPIRNQKIHWRSLEGLPNRGAVRFYPKGPTSCKVQLTISYEVPQILIPVAAALRPFSENMLLEGLKRFAVVAKNSQSRVS